MSKNSSIVDRAKSLSEQGASSAAKAATGEALGAVKERTSEMASDARSVAADLVSQGSRHVGSRVKNAGESVHGVEDVLRKRGLGKVADATGQAADTIEGFGSRLEQVGADSRWDRAKSFAARYRWALAAAGVVVGVAATWWLKASKRDIEVPEAEDSAKRLFRRLL